MAGKAQNLTPRTYSNVQFLGKAKCTHTFSAVLGWERPALLLLLFFTLKDTLCSFC